MHTSTHLNQLDHNSSIESNQMIMEIHCTSQLKRFHISIQNSVQSIKLFLLWNWKKNAFRSRLQVPRIVCILFYQMEVLNIQAIPSRDIFAERNPVTQIWTNLRLTAAKWCYSESCWFFFKCLNYKRMRAQRLACKHKILVVVFVFVCALRAKNEVNLCKIHRSSNKMINREIIKAKLILM